MRKPILTALALAALAAGWWLAPAAAGADVRVAASGKQPELVKKLPIAKRAGKKRRVIASLGPGKVGELRPGDLLAAAADFEVTVCLKPHHRYRGFPCVGRTYAYNPTIRAEIVLAPSAKATAPGKTLRIGSPGRITCYQRQPHRNRHCVLSLPYREIRLPQSLPCRPDRCHVNLVADASHRKARRGEQVVVGSHDRGGHIHQSRTNLVAVRTRGGPVSSATPRESSSPSRTRVPIANEAAGTRDRVIFSVPVHAPRAGDTVVADARLRLAIDHLPYKVAIRNEIVLATRPDATESSRASRRITDKRAKISLRNGWTCTLGRSAHKSPCAMSKAGAIRFEESSNRTFYVNVVIGAEANLLAGQRYRKGSRLKVRGERLRVWHYSG
jgi:hypothetical protein